MAVFVSLFLSKCGFYRILTKLLERFLSLSYSPSVAILQRRSQTVDVAVAIAASVLRPDTQVNGRQAVGRRPPKDPQPIPSPFIRPACTVSIYLSIQHPSMHPYRPFSPCQAAAKSALICGSPGKKFGVSMCLLRWLVCICVSACQFIL